MRRAAGRWLPRVPGRVPLRVSVLALAMAISGCATLSSVEEVRQAFGDKTILLLGEVHDNASQHERRAQALARWLESGPRPALLMEQFDRERQADIDRARAEPAASASSLVQAAGAKGWNWPLYEPYVALALKYQLPIVAANVSREDTRRIVREGLAAHGFDAAVPDELAALHADEIVDSHCGAIGPDLARRLALAQVARDQQMARLVSQHAARGVVLLAGNGHVRNDAGVPRWLTPALRARAVTIGWLEERRSHGMPFDVTLTSPAHPRSDPCEPLRGR
jgi:uncharacterized iron-regulated protein